MEINNEEHAVAVRRRDACGGHVPGLDAYLGLRWGRGEAEGDANGIAGGGAADRDGLGVFFGGVETRLLDEQNPWRVGRGVRGLLPAFPSGLRGGGSRSFRHATTSQKIARCSRWTGRWRTKIV
jgi:hypothetical protein